MNATPILETRGASKIYGEGDTRVVAVDAVSLSLSRGEVLLIMGPSGSGKTTLLSMMGCILRPTAGEIHIEGRKVSALSETELPEVRRHYLGFVFQSFNLFPSLTTQENVELVLRLKQGNAQQVRVRALELLERVGLARRAHLYPEDLSGGEKQRTALARALAGDPPILLADEPTANLDSRTGQDVLALLRGLAEQSDKAVAIVSHDPKAEDQAHRVVVLEDGRIKR
ncbi:MAG TPA: ABC transporter ATP-binding protein [Thiobacillaceae bacterium]|nr:ABC transporter ATP-binding protein [Thiobacillaceae bacterium]